MTAERAGDLCMDLAKITMEFAEASDKGLLPPGPLSLDVATCLCVVSDAINRAAITNDYRMLKRLANDLCQFSKQWDLEAN